MCSRYARTKNSTVFLCFLRRCLPAVFLVPAFLCVWSMAGAQEQTSKADSQELARYQAYKQVVDKTANMVSDQNVQGLAAKYGLQALNITWEDTARFQNSAVGPNISDMTIQMQQKDPRTGKYHLTCMPVIRFPNFTDKTADIDPAKFFLLAGNENGKALKRVSLIDFVANIRKYLSKPGSWKGDKTYLHSSRDEHVLVSAQACFLPIPKKGSATFNPVLFNYQSMKGDPAVLTILATREGTSVTVIDNVRDRFQARGGVWGQRLFFNHNGQRASLTGKRLSDYQAENTKKSGGPTVEAAGQKGLNMVLLIQVPLKQKRPNRFSDLGLAPPAGAVKAKKSARKEAKSDVEAAVIGHGKVEGPFTEIDNLDIQRDSRYPIRVTVQFYKATSNGVVSDKDMAEIAEQIKKVYEKGDFVGSLVVDGTTGRPTEYEGNKIQPPDWWAKFWRRYHTTNGRTRQEVVKQLRKLRGPNWTPLTERQLADDARKLRPVQQGFAVPGWAPFGILVCVAITFVLLSWRMRAGT